MESYKKFIWIGLAAIVVIAAGIYFFVLEKPPRMPSPGTEATSPSAGGKVASAIDGASQPLPALNDSDGWLAQRAKDLSAHPKLAEWLRIKDLIRRITAAVTNIAAGNSPRPHLKFMNPAKPFATISKGDQVILNPQSYRRYDLAAAVFSSLDAEKSVRIFQALKPLFQEAFRELGYPDKDFQETLVRAIKELLSAPVVEGDIFLEKDGATYEMVDGRLETLSDAQKHLLRMGPQNSGKIQKSLREMALAMGVPENQLPQSRVYRPGKK